MVAKKKTEAPPAENGWDEVVESWDDIFTFDKKNDTITGILQAKVPDVGPNRSTVYVIEKDGVKLGIWGSTILDHRMRSVNAKDEIMVVYLGKAVAPKSQREYHDFKVFTRGTKHTPAQAGSDDIPF